MEGEEFLYDIKFVFQSFPGFAHRLYEDGYIPKDDRLNDAAHDHDNTGDVSASTGLLRTEKHLELIQGRGKRERYQLRLKRAPITCQCSLSAAHLRTPPSSWS